MHRSLNHPSMSNACVTAIIGRDLPQPEGPTNIDKGLIDSKISQQTQKIQYLTL